ncbi:MAG: peptidyl-prolyl cis-trans isomerase [Bryobacteraceae bacterium]
MFDLFRSRAKAVRILLGGLLLLVALSMVTYLIPGVGMGTGGDPQIVAEFGKQALTLMEVQQAVQRQLRSQNIPPQMAASFVPQITNQMISEYALAYQAERMGFRLSEADMANAIRMVLPQLFSGGQFAGREAYAAFLAQQNMSIPQFEGMMRRQLLIDALRGLVAGGIVVTPAEVAQEFHARQDKVRIEYVALSPDKYRSQVTVSPEEIKAQYDRNRSGFQIPESRSLEAVIVDEARLAQTIVVPEEDLRRAYEQNKDSYRVPERVHVRHILLKTTDKPKEDIPKIRAKAEELLKQLKSGADFAGIAKKSSEDTGSAAKGGDLSWIVRGQTVKAFEEAAFSLKPKDLSGIVTTEYGFHILQVLEKQDAHVQPFEEVKAQLVEARKKQMVFDRMQEVSDQARAALNKDPGSAARIAAELNLQLVKAEKLGPGATIPEIGASPEFQDAISPLRKGEVSPVIQIAPTKLAVAVVTDVLPARQAELAEVEARIREQLMSEKLTRLVAQRANEVLERAKSLGGDIRKAAQPSGLEVKAPPEFTRDGAIEGLGSAGFVYDAFKAKVGDVLGPASINGQAVIYRVAARIPASDADLAAQRESLTQEIRATKARERVEVFEEAVREQLVKSGKIKVHQNVINRLVSSYSGA